MTDPVESLSEKQIKTLLEHLEKRCKYYPKGLRDYLIVSFMLQAGLRLGETLQLCWEYVTLEGVPLEAVNLPAGITKSGVARAVPMCNLLTNTLISYYRSKSYLAHNRKGLLFPSDFKRLAHLSSRTIQKFLEKESLACIGISVNPHMLRHTYATRMNKLVNMRIVQRLLGHSSIRSTQIYTHPDAEDLKNATTSLDELNKGM